MSTSQPDQLHFAILASDVVIFTLRENTLHVRLIKVATNPYYEGQAALPGGLIHPTETAEQAAERLVREKGKIDTAPRHITQLATFSRLDRDKRGRVVAVAYSAFYPWESLSSQEQSSNDTCWWQPVSQVKALAYDHDEILAHAVVQLQESLKNSSLIQTLLPPSFTLTELQQAYTSILGSALDRRNFQKKILKSDILRELSEKRSSGRMRPARLYAFKKRLVEAISLI